MVNVLIFFLSCFAQVTYLTQHAYASLPVPFYYDYALAEGFPEHVYSPFLILLFEEFVYLFLAFFMNILTIFENVSS